MEITWSDREPGPGMTSSLVVRATLQDIVLETDRFLIERGRVARPTPTRSGARTPYSTIADERCAAHRLSPP
jgi:hypothetical protein